MLLHEILQAQSVHVENRQGCRTYHHHPDTMAGV